MVEKRQIRISVRNLVEFILRSGDINSGFIGSNRAVEGTRIHQKLQKESKEDYEPEVTLKHSIEYNDFILIIEGRADGVIREPGKTTIDEIKTTTAPVEIIDENFNKLHWAQAKCYAYIYALQNEIEDIDVRLTYYQMDTEEIKYIIKTYDFDYLTGFFNDVINKYFIWMKMISDWSIKRDNSINNMNFPHEKYRSGQRPLAVAVYKTVLEGKKLFAQAPTGIGKTISTIFPAVKAMGQGQCSKIFYLTAKTITRGVAEQAFVNMKDKGLFFKQITLTAKDKICFKEKSNCNPEYCEYAKAHFDRVNDTIMDVLNNENDINRVVIESYAKKHRVCPFELSLDLTEWVDAVICDYNYVFDPSVSLKRFFSEKSGEFVFLIDEAHNLVDRSREMFSAELLKSPFLATRRLVKDEYPKLAKSLNKLNTFMLSMKKLCNDSNFYISKGPEKELYYYLNNYIKEAEKYLVSNQKDEGYEEMLELYFNCIKFNRIFELYDDRYTTYIEKEGHEIKLKLFCLDPSYLLNEVMKKGKSSILFSATLIPMDYHKAILGGDKEDYTIYLTSPFDKKNRCILIGDRISTKYRYRENSYEDISFYISSFVSQKTGNYMIFFPSYSYMNTVFDVFTEQNPDIEAYIQSPGMREEEREEFLNLFETNPSKTRVGFCVLGGIYGEGIDLKADRLIGVTVVGVGLPQMCLERNIIKDYFNKYNNSGYEYSYMYPA